MTTEREKLIERLRFVAEHGVNPSLRGMAKDAADMMAADGAPKFSDEVKTIAGNALYEFQELTGCDTPQQLREKMGAEGSLPIVDDGWRMGVPPAPFNDEWFIAILTDGGRVVLRALPEEFAYDFKTADDTRYMAHRIKKWMQFPDSQNIPFSQSTGKDSADGAQSEPTDLEITELAHRTASRYTHRSEPTYHAYTFLPHTLIDFARAILAKGGAK